MDFNKILTYPISSRKNKFCIEHMISIDQKVSFDNKELEEIADLIKTSRNQGYPVILMMGGAVIKDGCSLLLIDLIKNNFVTHIAMNGSVSIHDFEIAMIGKTSEDVQESLEDGSFGMADETGLFMNAALKKGFNDGIGYGESIAREIQSLKLPYSDFSILCQAFNFKVGISVHIAIGGDIIHQHPTCDGAALGATSYEDFKTFTKAISNIGNGVILNIGSAVIMPEVFLKALTISRNLGYKSSNFAIANFDFLEMYRPKTRVIEWPTSLGAKGYFIKGRHNITIPRLHELLCKQ